MRHADVALVGAVGKPDAYAGELPMAFVQVKPSRSCGAAELQEFAAREISERAAVPGEIVLLDELPLTAVGKIFKPDLRKFAAQKTFVDLLSPLQDISCEYEVEIHDDARLGSLCRITVTPAGEGAREEAGALIQKIMGQFTIAHEIAWRPKS